MFFPCVFGLHQLRDLLVDNSAKGAGTQIYKWLVCCGDGGNSKLMRCCSSSTVLRSEICRVVAQKMHPSVHVRGLSGRVTPATTSIPSRLMVHIAIAVVPSFTIPHLTVRTHDALASRQMFLGFLRRHTFAQFRVRLCELLSKLCLHPSQGRVSELTRENRRVDIFCHNLFILSFNMSFLVKWWQ